MIDNYKKNRIILTFIIIIVFIFLILFMFIMFNTKDNKIENAVDNEYSNIPHINLKIDGVEKINTEILNHYNYVMDSYENNQVKYLYYEDDEILSVLIEYVELHEIDNQYYHTFKSYNFDLKNKKILSNKDMLSRFGYTEDDLENILINRFKTFYNEEIELGYFTETERSFDSYLVFVRGVENLTEDVGLYVKDGKLVAYKGFNLNSDYNDYKYFSDNAFEFEF